MQPRITESDVEQMEGQQDVDQLHSAFYDDFLSIRRARKSIPDWLKDQNPDDYENRLHHHTYHEHVQGEMAAWLSTLQADNHEHVPARTVAEKYTEFKQEFRADHQHIQLDDW